MIHWIANLEPSGFVYYHIGHQNDRRISLKIIRSISAYDGKFRGEIFCMQMTKEVS